MSEDITLIGPLATPELTAALDLRGTAVTLSGRLSGGADAGLGGDWPAWHPGPGRIAGLRLRATPDLMRYLRIMELAPVELPEGRVRGLGKGGGADWDAGRAPLMAAVARTILARPDAERSFEVAARLPRIAEITAGRLRAQSAPAATAHLPPPDPDRIRIESRHEAYGRYFSVEEIALRHQMHGGGWSAVVEREVFMSADAALLLPYDPIRDQVLVVSQFRIGPLARGQAQCWMLEPIAGRIDAGETPAEAAMREAREEAGLRPGRLYPLPAHYPTPGANSEFFYPFVALADLGSHDTGRSFGLPDEGEDIATIVMPRAELSALAESGQLQCGPLVMMAFWLDRHADQLRAGAAEGQP